MGLKVPSSLPPPLNVACFKTNVVSETLTRNSIRRRLVIVWVVAWGFYNDGHAGDIATGLYFSSWSCNFEGPCYETNTLLAATLHSLLRSPRQMLDSRRTRRQRLNSNVRTSTDLNVIASERGCILGHPHPRKCAKNTRYGAISVQKEFHHVGCIAE